MESWLEEAAKDGYEPDIKPQEFAYVRDVQGEEELQRGQSREDV